MSPPVRAEVCQSSGAEGLASRLSETRSFLITTTLQKIEETDNTFRDSGKIGLWTKADSVSYFDDLHVTAR
jgi:hypothetical protein